MSGRYYVTTSIPYVNARPHIGFALEAVQADALSRYHRLRGDETRFLTGTDDNALKNVQAAEAAGISPQQLVDRNAAAFLALREPLNLSFDDFIRTSADARHADGVRKLWRACERAGDIYRRAYQGLYCIGCERFYGEDELLDGLCPIHQTRPELIEEENYFFRLSRYGEQLRELIISGDLRIEPETRRNEVLSFLAQGLEDFSVSRSQERARGWGIPVPDDPSQVMYVWYDALGNYITALDYADDGELYRRYWLENPNRVHVIGKDILRFHAVYWPAMLLSAGEPPPTRINVHEFLMVDGQKISKSLGNVVDPVALAEQFGTDALRYWLLREMPRTEDGDFSIARLVRRYDTDLANDLGNLLNRTMSMIARYRGGSIPAPGPAQAADIELRAIAVRLPNVTQSALEAFDFRAALAAVWELVTRANGYVETNAPWVLARQVREGDEQAKQRLDTVLYTLAESLRLIAYHLTPYIPAAAARITGQLGIDPTAAAPYHEATQWGSLLPGTQVATPQPVFPRIEIRPVPHPDVSTPSPAHGRAGDPRSGWR
jgi:methionyl-tRNA synthetase